MYLSSHSLLVVLVVGLVAGWLAGVRIKGSGFGVVADVIPRCPGALLGHRLARGNTGLGASVVAEAMNAVIGAPVVMFAGDLIAAGRRRRGLSPAPR